MRPKLIYLSALLLLFSCAAKGYKDYKDYKIYNVIAHTERQQELLHELSKDPALDFLALHRRLNEPLRVLVSPQRNQSFGAELTKSGIPHTLTVNDVSLILAEQRAEASKPRKITPRLDIFERFYRHEEINAHLENLAKNYPARAFVKTFGRSYEGRPLKTITITNGDGRTGKKVIFVDAAIHAREWITPAMAMHIINELLDNQPANSELLLDYDWVIMPVVNADGYEYTHTEDRYWRKTRRPSAGFDECPGADANRNFDFQWGLPEGASAEACDETYRGDYAFSEPESRVVRDIMWHYGERLKFYLTLHSYGNMLLLPWGYTSDIPDNFFDMMDAADAGAMAIVRATGSIYSYGNTHSVIYATCGDSADYAAGAVNIPVTIAMELPAGGFSGFDPPTRQIEDFVTETWIGVKAMAEVVVRNH